MVHSEISLPEHAPKEFADRSILWNSVEQVEKNKNAQLARMVKLNMPNAWSYDLAVATVRDYVQENFVRKVSNEVLDMIDRMAERKPTLLLPLVKGKYISSISNRDAFLNFDNARSYVKERHVDSFSTLATLKEATIKEHDELEQRTQTRSQKIARLKALAKAYSEYEAYKPVAEERNSLKGLKKQKFDKEHEQDLSTYQANREKLKALLNGGKVTPKAWQSECDTLIKEQQTDERSMSRKAVEIAFAQVLENSHKQLVQMVENDSHKQDRSTQRRKGQEI